MIRGACLRLLTATVVFAAEAMVAATVLTFAPAPAGAQLFEDRFPFQSRRRGPFDWFEPAPQQERAPPPDYSRAPAPKKSDTKSEASITTPIMVFGDAMADWLAYGLEQ